MGFVSDAFDALTGRGQRRAARQAQRQQEEAISEQIAAQQQAAAQGLEFLAPFGDIGQLGVEQAGFLIDPQAQFDFLQQNPLFQFSLDQLNQGTAASAAARGRLSAGDTLAQLQKNALLAAQPLIDRQTQGIGNLLNLGTGIAQAQANTALGVGSNISNLLGNLGNVQAAGTIAQQQAQQQGAQNLLGLGGALLYGGFSDSRLKTDAEIIGKENGYDKWKWTWNDLAYEKFGLKGESEGVMFIDVIEKNPEAASFCDGFGRVDYNMIGVSHG